MSGSRHKRWTVAAILAASALAAPPAWSHEGSASLGGFVAGFMHPLLGWDHLVAMLAVGLWGAFLGGAAIWVLPVAFPLVMAIGGALAVTGLPLPAVETGIATSAIVLGGAVAAAVRPPLWIAALLVGAFAILHGHAHGVELPIAASPVTYSAGFVVTTGLLHLLGIGIGTFSEWPAGYFIVRMIGAAITVVGIVFLAGAA